MTTESKLAAVADILRAAGASRARRFTDGVPGELVVVLDPAEFAALDESAVERELVAATRWKVWVTYERDAPVDLTVIF